MPAKTRKSKAPMHAKAKKARRVQAPKPKPAISAETHEELVIKKLMQKPQKIPGRSLEVQEIVYNSASELKSLAFKSGFNIGSEAYRHSTGSINSLSNLLEHGGLGKAIYYPFESHSIFTFYGAKSGGINLGSNIHVFEAGIISGYLSAHAKRQIGVEETDCVFNGSRRCKFVAKAGQEKSWSEYPESDYSNTVRALQTLLSRFPKHGAGGSYYLLSVRPLLGEPVFSEVMKFLYLTGKLVGRSSRGDVGKLATEASHFLRIGSAKVSRDRKGGIKLSVAYPRDVSSGHFVDMSMAFLSGIIKGSSGKGISVSRSLDPRGFYNVKMQIMEGKEED